MGGNTTDDSPLLSCVCLPVPVFPGRVGAGRCGPGGPRGPARGGGVGALLGPEGTGPAVRPLCGGGGPVMFSLVFPDSPGLRTGLLLFRLVGGGGVVAAWVDGRGCGWVFVNWIVDASI